MRGCSVQDGADGVGSCASWPADVVSGDENGGETQEAELVILTALRLDPARARLLAALLLFSYLRIPVLSWTYLLRLPQASELTTVVSVALAQQQALFVSSNLSCAARKCSLSAEDHSDDLQTRWLCGVERRTSVHRRHVASRAIARRASEKEIPALPRTATLLSGAFSCACVEADVIVWSHPRLTPSLASC